MPYKLADPKKNLSATFGLRVAVASQVSPITGDTLFRDSVGRTDFPGGSEKDLQVSLQKIKKIPATFHILPGHGDSTTLEEELRSNVFL